MANFFSEPQKLTEAASTLYFVGQNILASFEFLVLVLGSWAEERLACADLVRSTTFCFYICHPEKALVLRKLQFIKFYHKSSIQIPYLNLLINKFLYYLQVVVNIKTQSVT